MVFGWKDKRIIFRWDTECRHWEPLGPREKLSDGTRAVAVLSSGEFGHSKRSERRLVVLFSNKWVATEWSERLPSGIQKEVEHSPVEGEHCLAGETEVLEEEKSVQHWFSAAQQDREAAAEEARAEVGEGVLDVSGSLRVSWYKDQRGDPNLAAHIKRPGDNHHEDWGKPVGAGGT